VLRRAAVPPERPRRGAGARAPQHRRVVAAHRGRRRGHRRDGERLRRDGEDTIIFCSTTPHTARRRSASRRSRATPSRSSRPSGRSSRRWSRWTRDRSVSRSTRRARCSTA
jgi:hypothetical protein